MSDIEPEDLDVSELAEAVTWPPIPDEELTKGSTLSPERLVELGAMSGDPTSGRWAFRLLALRDEVTKRHRVSVRIVRGGLHINTDSEASEYHNGRGECAVGSIKRQVAALHNLVDPSRLTGAQQAAHDRSLCVWGAKMAALKRVTRQIPAIEHQ